MEQGLGRLQDLHVGSLKDIPIAFCAEILAQTNPFIRLELTLCDSWSSICVVCGENYVLGCVCVCICMYVILHDLQNLQGIRLRFAEPFYCAPSAQMSLQPRSPGWSCHTRCGPGSCAPDSRSPSQVVADHTKIALRGPWIRKTPRSNSQITSTTDLWSTVVGKQTAFMRRTFCKRSVKMESSF